MTENAHNPKTSADVGRVFLICLVSAWLARPMGAVAVGDLQDPNGQVDALTVSAGVLYLGGQFSQMLGPGALSPTARAYLAAVDLASGSLLGWNPGADGEVMTLAVSPQGTILAGGKFSWAGGLTRTGLVELEAWPLTGSATAWDPILGNNPQVKALAVGPSTVYAGGIFVTPYPGLAAFDIGGNTGWATAFNAGISGGGSAVMALCLQGGRLYVGGDFTGAAGASAPSLAAVDAATGGNLGWAPSASLAASPQVLALAGQSGVLYVGGNFSGSLGGGACANVAALSQADGHALWAAVSTDAQVRAVAVDGSGRVILGGDFSQVNGGAQPRLGSLDAASGAVDGSVTVTSNTGLSKVWSALLNGTQLLIGGTFSSLDAVGVTNAAQLTLAVYQAPSPTATGAVTPVTAVGVPQDQGLRWIFPNPGHLGAPTQWHLNLRRAATVRWRIETPRAACVALGQLDLPAGVTQAPVPWACARPGLYFFCLDLVFSDGTTETPPPYKMVVLP